MDSVMPVDNAIDDKSESDLIDRISVVIVDDHALVRRGFRRLLEDSEKICIIGEASHGVAAVKMVQELEPRVVVMDCALPGMSGLAATRRIVETTSHTSVLMLSMHAEY